MFPVSSGRPPLRGSGLRAERMRNRAGAAGARLGEGGADAIRTRDLVHAMDTLYQLSYGPVAEE